MVPLAAAYFTDCNISIYYGRWRYGNTSTFWLLYHSYAKEFLSQC